MNEKLIISFKKLLNDNKDNIICDILLNIFNLLNSENKDNIYKNLNEDFDKYMELKNSNIEQFKKYNYLVTSFCLLQNKNAVQTFIEFYLQLYNIDEENKLSDEDLFKKNIYLRIISFFLDFIILSYNDIKIFYKNISIMYHYSNLFYEDQIKSIINILKLIYQVKNKNSELLLNESYFLIKGNENICINLSSIREQSIRNSYNNEIFIFFDYFELINSNHLVIFINYTNTKITIIIENNAIKINNKVFQINQKYHNSFGFYFESLEKKLIFFHNEKTFEEDIKIEINSMIIDNIVLFHEFFGKIHNFGGFINLNNDNKKNQIRENLTNLINQNGFNYKNIFNNLKKNFENNEQFIYFIYLSNFYIEKLFNNNKLLDYYGKSIINFDKEIYINNNKHLINKIKYIGGFSVLIPIIRIILNDLKNNEIKKIYLDDIINLMIKNLINNSNKKYFKKEKIYELLCYYCKNNNYFDKKILEINNNHDKINNLYEYHMLINYNNELNNNNFIFLKNQIIYILIENCILILNNLMNYDEYFLNEILNILEKIDEFFNLKYENNNDIKLDKTIYFKIIEKIKNQILNINNIICVYFLKYLLLIFLMTFKRINNDMYNQIILNYFDYFTHQEYKIIKYIQLIIDEEEKQINEEIKIYFDFKNINNFVEFFENFGLLLFCYYLHEKDNIKKKDIIHKYKHILINNFQNFITKRAKNIESYFSEKNFFDYNNYFNDNKENNNINKIIYLFNINFPLLQQYSLFTFFSDYYSILDNNNNDNYNKYLNKIYNYFYNNINENSNSNNKRKIFFYEEEYLIFLLMLFQNFIDLNHVLYNDIIHLNMKLNLKKYLTNYFKCHIYIVRKYKNFIYNKYNFSEIECIYKKKIDLNEQTNLSQLEIEKLIKLYNIENCENIEQIIKKKLDDKLNYYFQFSENLMENKLIFYLKKSYYISKNINSKNKIEFLDSLFKKNEYNKIVYINDNNEQNRIFNYFNNLFNFNDFNKNSEFFFNNKYLKIKLLINEKKIEKFNKKLLNSLFIFNGFWSVFEEFNYKLIKLKNFMTNEYKLPLIKPIIDLNYYKLNFKYYKFDNFIRKNKRNIYNNKIRKININKESIKIIDLLNKEEINKLINEFINNMLEKGHQKFLTKYKFDLFENIIDEIRKKNLLDDCIKSEIKDIIIEKFNIIQIFKNSRENEFINNLYTELNKIIPNITFNINLKLNSLRLSKKEIEKRKSLLKNDFYLKIIEKYFKNLQKNYEKIINEINTFINNNFIQYINKIINEKLIITNINNLLLSDKYFSLKEVIFDQNILREYFKEKYKNYKEIKFYDCCLIKKTHHIKGFIFLYKNNKNILKICFVSYLLNNLRKDCNNIYENLKINCYGSLFECPEKDELKIIKINDGEIKLLFIRNYYYRNSGLEIYTINGKNYYFNFHDEETNKDFYKQILTKFSKLCPIKNDNKNIGYINEEVIKINKINFDSLSSFIFFGESKLNSTLTILDLIKNWEKGFYSNYYILMICNIISNRSFSDLSQYPVFPIIYFYKNIEDLKNSIFDSQINFGFQEITQDLNRNLELPLGQQENIYDNQHDRKNLYILTSNDCEEIIDNKFVKGNNVPLLYYYSLNYSNPVYVCYYLLRIIPFSFSSIEYQGNNFDTPNRLFISIYGTLINSNCQKSDIKEFIPEFYYFPEMFLNISNINLGEFRDKTLVNDVEIPKEINSVEKFVIDMYNKLEGSRVSEKIGNWIDLIFGVNQKCDNEEIKNVFKNKNKNKNISKRMSLKNLFRTDSYLDDEYDLLNRNNQFAMDSVEFGLIPIQFFNKNFTGKNKNLNKNVQQYFIKINDFCKKINIIDFNLCNIHNLENFEGKMTFNYSIVYDNKLAIFFNLNKNEQQFVESYNNNNLYLDCLEKRKCYAFINNDILLIGGNKNGFLKIIYIDYNKNQINENLLETSKKKNKENLIITSLEFINFYEKYYLLLGDNFGNVKINNIIINSNHLSLKKIKKLKDHSREVIYIVYNKNLNLWLSVSLDGFINIYTFEKCDHVGNINIKDEYQENLLYLNYINFISKPISCIILCIKNKFISYSINGKKLDSFVFGNCFNFQIFEDKNFRENLYYLEKNIDETTLYCKSLPYFNEYNKLLVRDEKDIKFYYLDNFNYYVYILYSE